MTEFMTIAQSYLQGGRDGLKCFTRFNSFNHRSSPIRQMIEVRHSEAKWPEVTHVISGKAGM